jgi:queuosine precursor transporter
MDHFLKDFLAANQASPEVLALLTLIVASVAILVLFRLYGMLGLMCYITMAYIATNIQVLHLAQYSFASEPVALGTVLFATTFLVSDIITEHYGAVKARMAIGLSFITQIAFTILMILTVAHPPLENAQVLNAMDVIFMPAPRLLVASLLSYVISQLVDIWLFQKISKQTHKKHLWFRTFISTALSALVDNIIFSTLAWVILSPNPVSFNSLVYTYILGTYVARLLVSILSTPIIYLSYYCLPKNS